MAQALVSKSDVQKARAELGRMRGSLSAWLKYRELNDAVVAGKASTSKPRAFAVAVIEQSRDQQAEQKLAKQLYVLLAETMPGVELPDANLQVNPDGAVQLARLALYGPPAKGNQAQGAWYTSWPVLIVGGLLLSVTTVVTSMADVAKEREHYACVRAGACTDYGFWLKAGGIAALLYVAWHLGAGERVKRYLKS